MDRGQQPPVTAASTAEVLQYFLASLASSAHSWHAGVFKRACGVDRGQQPPVTAASGESQRAKAHAGIAGDLDALQDAVAGRLLDVRMPICSPMLIVLSADSETCQLVLRQRFRALNLYQLNSM